MTNEDLHKIIDYHADAAVLEIHKVERGVIRQAIWSAVVTILNKKDAEAKEAKTKGAK